MRFQRGKIWFLELLTRLHTFPLRRAKSSGSLTGTMQPKVDGDTIESPESVNKRSLISVVQYWTFLFSNNFSFHFMKIFLNTLSSHAQKIARKNFFFRHFLQEATFSLGKKHFLLKFFFLIAQVDMIEKIEHAAYLYIQLTSSTIWTILDQQIR